MIRNNKLLLLLLVILLKMSFAGSSQIIDTTCVPTGKLRQVITDAKLKPVLEERISILTERIADKDKAIANLQLAADQDYATIEALKEVRRTLEEEKKIYNDQLRTYESM